MVPSPDADNRSRRRAAGVSPDIGALRRSYLDLLKLCLCDLVGASTREVRWTGDKRIFSRALTDSEQVGNRAQGKDWPLDGLTMIGLDRLDDLQACVESVVSDDVPGDLIEAGAWRGGASILMRATLDSMGAQDRMLWVADSFQGFRPSAAGRPTADRELESDMSRIGFLAPELDTVREYFARFGLSQGVNFIPGYFEETMSGLRDHRWSLVRLDADTYHATKLALETLYPGLAPGGYLIVDDYFHPYLPESCRKAVDEFRQQASIDEPIEQIDWNGARWRKLSELAPARAAAPARGRAPWSGPARARGLPIPTDRELQLQDQLAALEAQLLRGEAETQFSITHLLARLIRRVRHGVTRFGQTH